MPKIDRGVLRSIAVLQLAVASSLLSTGAASAEAEVNVKAELKAHFGYYLKDGGYWRQENSSHEPGSDSPVAYLKAHRWGPGESMVFDNTYALMEDGSCAPWTHGVYSWDHKQSAVAGTIYHRNGFQFAGTLRLEPSATDSTPTGTFGEFSAVFADGTTTTMRDATDRSDPARAKVVASVQEGEGWIERDPVYWSLLPEKEWPCGSLSEPGEEAGIRATLGRYLRGSSYNDPELIASAFYDDADLFLSHPEKEIFLMTVSEYAAIFANRETGKFNGRTGEILSIDYANDIAIAKAEIGFTERESRYIDLFLLKRLQGEWKIISKTATQIH